jgi:hypothetical protein
VTLVDLIGTTLRQMVTAWNDNFNPTPSNNNTIISPQSRDPNLVQAEPNAPNSIPLSTRALSQVSNTNPAPSQNQQQSRSPRTSSGFSSSPIFSPEEVAMTVQCLTQCVNFHLPKGAAKKQQQQAGNRIAKQEFSENEKRPSLMDSRSMVGDEDEEFDEMNIGTLVANRGNDLYGIDVETKDVMLRAVLADFLQISSQ